MDITTSICGVKLDNPTVLAAGILGVSASALVLAARNGAGAVTSKSIGPKEREGHNNPIIVEFEGGFVNAVGLPNSGVENMIDEIKLAVKNSPSPVIASIFGGTKEEFGFVASKISEAKPAMIEANLSCPNASRDFGTPFSLNAQAAASVIEIVKESTKIPVIAKLAPNVPDIKTIAKSVEEAGADAISAVNTMPGMVIDIQAAKPVLHNKTGGISGTALKPVAVKCVYDIYEAVSIPVVGIGGVTYGKDAVEIIMAGATAVQIGTGIYYRGVDIFKKVTKEMEDFMKENGYSAIKDMTGIAHN